MPTIREVVEARIAEFDAVEPKPTYDVEVEYLRSVISIMLDALDALDPTQVFDRAVEEVRQEELRYSVRVGDDTAEADDLDGAKLALETLDRESIADAFRPGG